MLCEHPRRNELQDLGFPPELLYYNKTTTDENSAEAEFIRIGSFDLQGRVALLVRSRPLNKDLLPQDITFQLDTLQDLNNKIRAQAEQNQVTVQRRGCTSVEIYGLYKTFFNNKLKEALRVALEDLAASQLDPSRGQSLLSNHSKNLVTSAKTALLSYAADLEAHSKERVKDRLLNSIVRGEDGDDLMPDEEHVDRFVSKTVSTLKETAQFMGNQVLQEVKGWFQAASTGSEEEDDTIRFSDW